MRFCLPPRCQQNLLSFCIIVAKLLLTTLGLKAYFTRRVRGDLLVLVSKIEQRFYYHEIILDGLMRCPRDKQFLLPSNEISVVYLGGIVPAQRLSQ